MKKFNVRFSAIGGILLLGSFAFALAQHDSRKRSHGIEDSKPLPSQPAVPIAYDASEVEWHQAPDASLKPVVRGNNNRLFSDADTSQSAPVPPDETLNPDSAMTYDNPLRSSVQAYAVVTASGEEPAKPNQSGPSGAIPSPPSWLSESLPAIASQVPPGNKLAGKPAANFPAGPPSLSSSNLPDSAGAPKLPRNTSPNVTQLPSFPLGNNTSESNANRAAPAAALPAASPAVLPNSIPSLLPNGSPLSTIPNQHEVNSTNNFSNQTEAAPNSIYTNSLSDTQRPGMQATNLPATPASTLPGSVLPNLPGANGTGAIIGQNANTGSPTNSLMSTDPARANSSSNGFGQSSFNTSQFPNSSGRAPTALTSLVSNEPGNRYLDGSQNPIMLIQKRGPEEVRVGKKATFVITVRNAGNSTAHDVTVVDSVPLGMRFSDANPPVTPTAEGLLTWKLGEMPAGDERTINLQMIPERQGELGSVATVHFTAQASLRTVATQPKLEIQIDAQQESLIGDSQLIAVTVKNVGTGVARGIRLEADLPPQLRHESGDQHLEAIFPNELAPNQSQRIELRSTAAQPGDATCIIRALTEDGTDAQQQVPITVLAPALVAAIEGPRLRYLDRQATYRFTVQNNGTASATNLRFVVRLPSGLRFNASDNQHADYNPADHTVTLKLAELPVATPAPFELTVLPVERGTQVLTLSATGDLGVSAEAKGQVVVEGLAELAFTIGQDNGTIETGASSTYTVQVTNIGNNPDKDVRLAVQLPAGAQVLKVDAPVRYRTEGNQILFEPIPEMRNKDQFTFRFEVRHTQAGSLIVRTQLTSANWPVAVVKEEGTLVYNDQN